jgi:hypothetical protein
VNRVIAVIALAILFASPAAAAEPVSYAALDTVLARHLRDGRVGYGALARDREPLERFLGITREARPDAWPRADQIAFWVNVYNARVLEGVIRRPGLKSVLDVGKVIGVPTLGFFRERARSGGRDLSLNDIEHEILRKGFQDERVHFVLNCASASCPALPERALSGKQLDAMLDEAARAFLNDPARNQVAPDHLRLSAIFQWYRGDFEAAGGNLAAYVRRYWKGPGPLRPDARIEFLDYDWSLNGAW